VHSFRRLANDREAAEGDAGASAIPTSHAWRTSGACPRRSDGTRPAHSGNRRLDAAAVRCDSPGHGPCRHHTASQRFPDRGEDNIVHSA